MKLQASQFADVFTHMRDHAKPYTEQDAADLAKVRAPMPPSKAHLARLKRHASGKIQVDAARVPTPQQVRTREETDRQHAFYKAMIADLGGSRTIAPTDEGRKLNAEAEAGLHFIPPVYNSDCVKKAPIETEQQKLQKEGERLMRLHHSAMAKANLVPHDLPADVFLSL